MRRLVYGATVCLSLASVPACSDQQAHQQGPEGRLRIAVSPLTLEGIDEVIYNLAVTANSATVWSKTNLSSVQFGSGPNLTYIGTCDAQVLTNIVTVEVVSLRSGGEDVLASEWRNPGPISVPARCIANADTLVEINLSIMRAADQGFFDIAVNFDDIFCSAKLDCGTASEPIRLVNNPDVDGPNRLRTAVMGFSCTSGRPGVGTTLYLNELRVVCDGEEPLVFDPALPVGNQPGGEFIPRTMRFRDQTNFGSGVTGCAWNQAIGFAEGTLGNNCRLESAGTASRGTFGGARSPINTVYPKITWSVPLTNGLGELVCLDNPLDGFQANGQPSGVTTGYTGIGGEAFDREWTCGPTPTEPVVPGLVACGSTVSPLGSATATETSRGIVVSAAGVQSPAYLLPAEYRGLGDACCGAACCQ